jgi:hypothetical protein
MDRFLLPICIAFLVAVPAKIGASVENALSSTHEANALLEAAKLELGDIARRIGNTR